MPGIGKVLKSLKDVKDFLGKLDDFFDEGGVLVEAGEHMFKELTDDGKLELTTAEAADVLGTALCKYAASQGETPGID